MPTFVLTRKKKKYNLLYLICCMLQRNLPGNKVWLWHWESCISIESKTNHMFSVLPSIRTHSSPIQWKSLLTVIALAPRIRSHGAITGEAFPLLITDALIRTGIFLAGSAWSWRRYDKKRVKQSWENHFSQVHKSSNSSLPLVSGSSCRRNKALTKHFLILGHARNSGKKSTKATVHSTTKQQTVTQSKEEEWRATYSLLGRPNSCLVLAQKNLL